MTASIPPEFRARVEAKFAGLGIVHQPTDYSKPDPKFHKGQLEVWDDLHSTIVGLAGAQGGKSKCIARWVQREVQRCLPLIMLLGYGRGIIAGPTLSLMEAQVIPQVRTFMEDEERLGVMRMGGKPIFNYSPQGLTKTLGTSEYPVSVHFAYTNDSSNLESMTAMFGAWDEAGQKENKQASYQAIIRRLSVARSVTMTRISPGKYEAFVGGESRGLIALPEWWETIYGEDLLTFGRLLFTTTPYEWGWFKSVVVDVADKFDTKVINWPSWYNPVVSKETCEAEKQRMPAWQWSMMYEGKYTMPAGMVYDCFDDADIIEDLPGGIPLDWKIYVGVDFGNINTAAVMFAHDYEKDEYHVFTSYHQPLGADLRVCVQRIKNYAVGPIELAWGGAASEDRFRKDWENAGLPVKKPFISGLEEGISRVYLALSMHKLKFWREGASELIKDLKRYSRETDPEGNVTIKIVGKDTYHRADAARYLISSQIPLPELPMERNYGHQ